ncbi:hypothetical protein PW52_07805 [Tamlana sedimentorum]|uniref:Uncharacterized protein n=1 Tax=Neotamlana sedimentorum TaxID=1435349 RepID=A0A0D7W983_9FLAO|nr:hypothetical protein [Tamlana sedimentorum]KJD35644.1 hypothetical protein PW52_07805 [Tamlana sedimentorum]
MKIDAKKWTEGEFKAYVLLFCANSNYREVSQDINILKHHVGKDELQAVSNEFDKDNDYQSIQKICMAIEEQGYSKDQLQALFQEIKELFLSGEKFDNVKKNIFMSFKRMLISAE